MSKPTELILKYRPASWDDVVGHEDVVESIQRVLEAGSSRSFIFTGPSGVGKTTLARLVAWAVGCDKKNLLEFDAATHTGIDDIRSVTENMAYRGMGKSGVRVVIVDECHSLSGKAWQALLKPIEEAPAHVWWIFCTTEGAKIPDTVRTRCVKYDLSPVDDDEIADFLDWVVEQEELEVDSGVLGAIVRASRGSPRRALAGFAVAGDAEDRKTAQRLLQSVSADDGEVRDLCLALGKGTTWERAMKLLGKIGNVPPETIRILVVRWFAAVAKKSSAAKAGRAMAILEAFEGPYAPQSGEAPLLLSLGRLLLMDDDE